MVYFQRIILIFIYNYQMLVSMNDIFFNILLTLTLHFNLPIIDMWVGEVYKASPL